jgi:putative glutamine amidotransferase
MTQPRIAITAWRRTLSTFLSDQTDLYTLGAEYADALHDAGAVPILLTHVKPDQAEAVLYAADGLVVTGGDDVSPLSYGAPDEGVSKGVNAAADHSEMALLREARRRDIPTLAICRGMQVLNVAFGGTLHQDITQPGTAHEPISEVPAEVMAARHRVVIVPGSRLASIFGAGERVVNTIHHQAVDRLADGFKVTARASDSVIEGMESSDGWDLIAVQWHPEKSLDTDRSLFDAFVAMVGDQMERA